MGEIEQRAVEGSGFAAYDGFVPSMPAWLQELYTPISHGNWDEPPIAAPIWDWETGGPWNDSDLMLMLQDEFGSQPLSKPQRSVLAALDDGAALVEMDGVTWLRYGEERMSVGSETVFRLLMAGYIEVEDSGTVMGYTATEQGRDALERQEYHG